MKFNSKELNSISSAIQQTLNYSQNNLDISIKTACIGAAGAVSQEKNYVELTNASWNVSIDEIIKKTSLKNVSILNDFQLIGYALNIINERDVFTIRSNNNYEKKLTKAVIGAGTGLGKSTVVFNKYLNAYVPIPSEGGHADLPVQTEEDVQLINFIKKIRQIHQPITYEEVLSGRGLENIYLCLKEKINDSHDKYLSEIDESTEKAALISKYRNVNETCKETFKIFTKYYARCAKNFVLDTMATGGLYIAGGIASKNKDVFASSNFIKEFENAYRRSDILKKIPIYVIINYDISLHGACFAAMHLLPHKKA